VNDDVPVFDVSPEPDPQYGHTFKLDWGIVDQWLARRRARRIARQVAAHGGEQIAQQSARRGGSNG
jgi:hypothetical protein